MLKSLNFKVFDIFQEICNIPHGSGDEKAISDYLVKFANDRGLKVVQDHVLNVIIYKDATNGSKDTVILQSHMDMVCEKNSDVDHDFLKDPIKTIIDGDFVKADRTTLGADNGIGLAISLAILDSDIPHPALEVLVTTNEETGMNGAKGFDKNLVKGRTIINLDNEEDNAFLTSCAGGMRADVTYPLNFVDRPSNMDTYSITVRGLKGGHSGMEIILDRGNSNLIMARVINSLMIETDVYLQGISGGSKDNAIPREADATVCISSSFDVDTYLKEVTDKIINEYKVNDPELKISWEKIDNCTKVIDKEIGKNIIGGIMLLPNGVLAMSQDIKGLVETSSNIGVVINNGDSICVRQASRSSVTNRKDFVRRKIEEVARMSGGICNVSSSYPSWQFNPNSKIREVFIKEYKELFKEEPKIDAIHAGLECGLFEELFGEVDLIAYGPNIFDAHTPEERVSISSTKKVYDLVVKVLSNL